jgi:acyl carrier protein
MATRTAVAPPATQQWSEAQLEGLVIDLLAGRKGVSAPDMRQQLLQKGGEMPVDSLEMLALIQRFRQSTGLRLPVKKLRSQTMRSVKAFAQFAANEATTG